jgi:hypothetical protein
MILMGIWDMIGAMVEACISYMRHMKNHEETKFGVTNSIILACHNRVRGVRKSSEVGNSGLHHA